MTSDERGFTLVEVMITISIMAALAALTVINLGQPQTAASLDGTVTTLVGDIKGQQMLAMAGNQGSSSAQQPHGVVFTTSDYTLFAGAVFDDEDEYNFVAEENNGVTFNTTLPNETLLFSKTSGEVIGFTEGDDTITITKDNASKTITINRFGAITVN